MTTQVERIELVASPHPGQREVHESEARFRVLDAGRRWGKTRLGVNECVDVAGQGGRAWWVAPSYKLGEVGWRPLRRIGAQIGAEIRRADRQIVLPGDGTVTVRSADDPNSLRGEGLDLAVLDECAFMQEAAWVESLRPALSDRLGKAIFISTPRGRNWFCLLWQRGQDDQYPDWQSWKLPTSDNPHINPEEIEDARNTLPDRVFKQEYLAEFLEGEGMVFRNIESCVRAVNGGPQHGSHYVLGVDLGKHQDFTVLYVMDQATGQGLYLDRFSEIDWPLQKSRIIMTAREWNNARAVIDASGIGDPIYDDLVRVRDMVIDPYKFTSPSKAALIEALMVSLEQGYITIPPDPILIEELKSFEYTMTRTGKVSYGAPPGMHDDCVIALALANWRLRKNTADWGRIKEVSERMDDIYKPIMAGISDMEF